MGVPLPPDSPTRQEPSRVATTSPPPPSAPASSTQADALARSHAALFALPALNDPRYTTVQPRSRLPPVETPLPPPPSVPFDASTATSSQAWDRWLSERNHRRQMLDSTTGVAGSSLSRRNRLEADNSETSEGRLTRLRQSAERLRVDIGGAADSTLTSVEITAPRRSLEHAAATATAMQTSLETSRQTLEQVRQRLDETRERVVAASTRVETSTELMLARERLEWSTTFVTRIDALITHLSAITDRASSLHNNSPTLATTSTSSDSALLLVTSSSALESPAATAATDALRVTVRQLVGASQRVSAAIERHRASVAAAQTTSAESVPFLRLDVPLRVSLPSSSSASSGTAYPLSSTPVSTSLSPSSSLDTSPNLSGLLLPTSTGSYPITSSPLPLSPSPSLGLPPTLTTVPNPPFAVIDPLRETYPGERRQILRLAQLQRDIADRGAQLRDLRGRADELAREQAAFAAPGRAEAGGATGEVKDEEEEEDEGTATERPSSNGGSSARALTLEQRRAAAEAKLLPGKEGGWVWLTTDEEKARDYAAWSRCGR